MVGSGAFPHFEGDVDPMPQVEADIAAGVAAAEAVAAARMADAARFITENGHEVVSGHASVRTPPGGPAWAQGNAPYANDSPDNG